MQPANDNSVLGDFSNISFTYFDRTTTFFRDQDHFMVRTDGPDGSLHEYRVSYTFGVTPLQQYLIEFPGGRLQALSVAWDSRPRRQGGQRWFHLYPEEEIRFDDALHWTGRNQRWNSQCAYCHSTNVDENYDVTADAYATTWSDVDVSCEACHGPGSSHVRWARHGRAPPVSADGSSGLTVTFGARPEGTWVLDAEQSVARRTNRPDREEIETCAPCHSRRAVISDTFVPGDQFLDGFRPALLTEGLYYPDGQMLDEVYVFGSFLQSAMYAAGVTCSDCHDPHTLRVRDDGNALCSRCHRPTTYDTPSHHFHRPTSPGARCVECHMPSKRYMVVDVRRDHSLRVPRPDLSVTLGTPNACNGCHVDRSPDWAAQAVRRWYGPKREHHFAQLLRWGQQRKPMSDVALAALSRDTSRPGIVRASAMALLRNYPTTATVSAVTAGLADTDPLVRWSAVMAAEALEPRERYQLIYRMLRDSVRLVRDEAALTMASVPASIVPRQLQPALDSGLASYVRGQLANPARPEAHVNIGVAYVRSGRFDDATTAFRTAMRLDSSFVPAYVNLADLRRLQGHDADGEPLLRRAVAVAPADGAAEHALGLWLVRQERYEEALGLLRTAARLAPSNARFAYVFGVALHSQGRVDTALAVLQETSTRHPYDLDVLAALVSFNRDRGDQAAALRYARRIANLVPDDPGVQGLVESLDSEEMRSPHVP